MTDYEKGDLEKSSLDDLQKKFKRQIKFLVLFGVSTLVAHTVVLYFIALNVQKEIVSDILKQSV